MAARSSADPGAGLALLLTCEHASRAVPARWRALFAGRERLLASHRGWDRDALPLARALARRTGAPLIEGRVSRLLVDLNRPADDPGVLSRQTGALPEGQRRRLLAEQHAPHWRRVQDALGRLGAAGPVLHLGVHSFTPVRDGVRRRFDVGLLFDPARPREAALARALRAAIARRDRRLRVRFNQPYLGSAPGLTTSLRQRLPDARYAGIELELNQRFVRGGAGRHAAVQRALVQAVGELLASAPGDASAAD